MLLNTMLPWFPIVLSAAVGARLVGPAKASWLGLTCALFWVIVVQTTSGVPFWADPVTFASLLAGSAAIVGMAHWSGVHQSSDTGRVRCADRSEADHLLPGQSPNRTPQSEIPTRFDAIAGAITEFDDWLEAHRFSTDAWPAFDEFLRHSLYTHCGATHTRPYRILSEGDGLVPLRALKSTDPEELASARRGILGHVATTGRPFYATDPSQGELVMALAKGTDNPPAWCFAIRQGARSIGLVSVGHLADESPSPAMMRAMERLTGQFWATLSEVCRSRSAVTTDPVSGLMTREAFLDEARRSAGQSYEHGEPVAMAVIAVEGLRTLVDQGRWDLANDVVYEVSVALRDRVRPDDLLGRFDDARFLLMLRRVDSELASLIAAQLTERLARLPTVEAVGGGDVGIRCGVSGSGTGSPPVTELVADAVRLCHRARESEVPVASDLNDECRLVGVRAPEILRCAQNDVP